MGIDAGFDMVPPLSRGAEDEQNWETFLHIIKEHYKDDLQVEQKPNYIEFKAGEHPKLPYKGHRLLRFSSKISGRTSGVEDYINFVTRIAKKHFGPRVQYWNECFDEYGHYDWKTVNASIKSYEQPDAPELPADTAPSTGGTDTHEEPDGPLYNVEDVSQKGKGLVARVQIPKGTRIICEKPLLIVRSMPPRELESYLAGKLKTMSRPLQRQFLSLHNNFAGKYPFGGIVKTNALPCGSGSPIGGVYPTICLINHSCIPNAHNNWNSKEEHETIHAIRPILKGEEITISYDHGGPSHERQAFLKAAFGFTCTCSICTGPKSLIQASDARRTQMQSLDAAIGDPAQMMSSPHDSLRNCFLLLGVLEQEFDGHAAPWIARLYYDAFQISIAHGDQARASVFAGRVYKARVICEGEDSPETQKSKSLESRPASHKVFGVYPSKLETTRTMIPRTLDTAQFEKWLFRQA